MEVTTPLLFKLILKIPTLLEEAQQTSGNITVSARSVVLVIVQMHV